MSRVAKKPVTITKGVEITIDGRHVAVKGPKGTLEHAIPDMVEMHQDAGTLVFTATEKSIAARALSGTTRSLVNNMVVGVSEGFERKLELVGVGYRVQAQGKVLNLTLGFSHPINFELPEGITAETPSQTEVVIRGANKQQVGQVAAKIRAFRPPEPYKGKGVKYKDEIVARKEAKKK